MVTGKLRFCCQLLVPYEYHTEKIFFTLVNNDKGLCEFLRFSTETNLEL